MIFKTSTGIQSLKVGYHCGTENRYLPGGTSPALCLCNSLSTCLLNFDSSANDNLHTSQTKGLLNKKMLATTSECFRIIEQICTHCQTSIAKRTSQYCGIERGVISTCTATEKLLTYHNVDRQTSLGRRNESHDLV